MYPPLPGGSTTDFELNSVSVKEEDGNVMNKVIHILGNEANGMPRQIVLDFIIEKDTINLTRLDQVITKFELSRYQAHQRDVKHMIEEKPMGIKARDPIKHPRNPPWERMSALLTYLASFFEMKFRGGLVQAFAFLDLNRNGQLSFYEWLHGLHRLGIDSITSEEAEDVFNYLDADQKGEIGLEQFRDIHHEDREPKPSQMPSRYSKDGKGNAERVLGSSFATPTFSTVKSSVAGRNANNDLNSLGYQTL
jgi:hypothetical protein